MERKPSKRRLLVLLAVAGAIGIAALLMRGAPRPALTWFAKGAPVDGALTQLTQDDTFELQLDLDESVHAYVASYAPSQGLIALFPSQQLVTDLPAQLPAGTHRLPGLADGKPAKWTAMWPVRSLTVMVVLGREPQLDLDALFAKVRQMGNRAFEDRSMGLYAPNAGMKAVPPRGTLPQGLLRRAFDLTANGPQGGLIEVEDGVWIGTLKVEVTENPEAKRDPLLELKDKVSQPPK